jgi:hypothetical protein
MDRSKFDIFISYSRQDFDEVNTMVSRIKEAIPWINIWFDVTGIESGDEFQKKIVSAIDDSSIVFFALSENSINKSTWTKKEIMYAKNNSKRIIPALLKGSTLKGWFLFEFGTVDSIDIYNDLQWNKLIKNLSEWFPDQNVVNDQQTSNSINMSPEEMSYLGKKYYDEKNYTEETYDVFISYSRKDTDVANQICDAFDKHGITYFIDRQGIGGGQEFPDVLADAICDSNLFLFIASENSYESKFTKSEITFAFNEKPHNSILPYIIDASTPPRGIRFTFSAINWRNIKEHPIETTLVQDICKLLRKSYTVTQKRDVTVGGGKSPTATVDNGNSEANLEKETSVELFSLGKKYYEEKNYIEATKYYRKSAEQGNSNAQCNLGFCYELGKGVSQDYTEAVKWYRKAAEQGNASAQFNLGRCYHSGHGVGKDYLEAVKWYRYAAEQSYVIAQYQLGQCYYYGIGVDYDRSEAVKWYRKAAKHGYSLAKAKLKDLAEKISDNK